MPRKRQSGPLTEQQKSQAIALRATGASINAIATATGRSFQTVKRFLNSADVAPAVEAGQSERTRLAHSIGVRALELLKAKIEGPLIPADDLRKIAKDMFEIENGKDGKGGNTFNFFSVVTDATERTRQRLSGKPAEKAIEIEIKALPVEKKCEKS